MGGIISSGAPRAGDTDTGKQIGEPLTGQQGPVFSVAFSPDGQRLASGSRDETARMWPAVARTTDLCDKLTANMSHRQWDEWVSPTSTTSKPAPDSRCPPTPGQVERCGLAGH